MFENVQSVEFPFDINELLSGDIITNEVGSIQMKIMNMFRLTDAFKQVFGEYFLERIPNGVAVQRAIEAIKKYKHVEEVDIQQSKSLLIDILYDTLVLGFLRWEFFAYGLEGKTVGECLEFMPNRAIFAYYGALNQDHESKLVLNIKEKTYRAFKRYFKRELISVSKMKDLKKFANFCSRHPKFIIKPSGAAMGRGIRIVDVSDFDSVEAVFADVISDCTEENAVVCEELIKQHECFSQIHPESVNSVRVFTYFNGENTRIVCAWLKAGIGSAVVDNGGAGGMLAAINEETGLVYTDAADEMGNVYSTHPDTGFVFNGFQIPQWKELLRIVKRMAPKLPGVPMIGWDLAFSDEKGWQVIEGNLMGQLFLVQIPTKRGMRKELTERFEWDKHKKKAPKKK